MNLQNQLDMLDFISLLNKKIEKTSQNEQTTICIPYIPYEENSNAELIQVLNSSFFELFKKIIKKQTDQNSNIRDFESLNIDSVVLLIRSVEQKRFIYFTYDYLNYDSVEMAESAYKLMVKKCYVLAKLLEKTQKVRIIVLGEAPNQRVASYKFDDILSKVMKRFRNHYELDPQFYKKIQVVVQINDRFRANEIKIVDNKELIIGNQTEPNIQQVNMYFVLQSEENIYHLQRSQYGANLISIDIDQFYYSHFISNQKLKNLFYYKRFENVIDQFQNYIKSAQPNIKDKQLDEYVAQLNKIDADLSSEIYCLTHAIVNQPLQIITRIIDKEQNIKEIDQQKNPRYKYLFEFDQIKSKFSYEQQKWNQQKNYSHYSRYDRNQQRYTFQFKIYRSKSEYGIVKAKFLNQIKNKEEAMNELINEIRNADTTKPLKKIQLQNSHKAYLVELVRGIKSLEPHFPEVLKHYDGEFFQRLVIEYYSMYEYFCLINKKIYYKSFQLAETLSRIKNSSKDIVKIVKTINIRYMLKERNHNQEILEKYERKLIDLEKIISDNISPQISSDKELKHKKYVLSETKAIISHQIAVLKKNQTSPEAQQRYKEALKLLFEIFLNPIEAIQDSISQSIRNNIKDLQAYQVNTLATLARISEILLGLGQIELSIEIQKNLSETNNVDKRYKRWLITFSGYDQQFYQIIESAIIYFKQIGQFAKVQQYYNIIIQKCPHSERKAFYRSKLQEFMEWLYLPKYQLERNKLIEGLKNHKWPIKPEYIDKIKKIYTNDKN